MSGPTSAASLDSVAQALSALSISVDLSAPASPVQSGLGLSAMGASSLVSLSTPSSPRASAPSLSLPALPSESASAPFAPDLSPAGSLAASASAGEVAVEPAGSQSTEDTELKEYVNPAVTRTCKEIRALDALGQEIAVTAFMTEMQRCNAAKYQEIRNKAAGYAGGVEQFERMSPIQQLNFMVAVPINEFIMPYTHKFHTRLGMMEIIMDMAAQQLTPSMCLNLPEKLKRETLQLCSQYDTRTQKGDAYAYLE